MLVLRLVIETAEKQNRFPRRTYIYVMSTLALCLGVIIYFIVSDLCQVIILIIIVTKHTSSVHSNKNSFVSNLKYRYTIFSMFLPRL